MTDWHELVIEGSEKVLRAFVAGFVAGQGEHLGGMFGGDLQLETESLGERLKALFVAGSHHVFLAPAALAVPLADEITARGAEIGLRLEHRRLVGRVSFRFRGSILTRPCG